MDETQDETVVLPPVPLDPLFADAVDEALAGPQVPTSPHDPNRVLGADPHDFAGLYLRHRSSFAMHARRFLRDPRDVDEVVQEAFLRLFLALPELTNELQALAYCRRTITNLCIDRYRADQRRPRLVDLESVPADALGDDELEDPVIQAEDAAIVREALALLTPLHREALVKREIEEKPLPVIATELGVPEDSVKHLLHRARRALRRHLAATHLAPGADLDGTSTLTLLARSAVSGSGRVGVLVVLLIGAVAGVSTTEVPAQAYDTISKLWQDDAPAASGPRTAGPETDAPGAGSGPPRVEGRDRPGAVVAGPAAPALPDTAARLPTPAPVTGTTTGATTTVTTVPRTRPTPVPAVPTAAAPAPSPEAPAVPPLVVEADPRPSSSPAATSFAEVLDAAPGAGALTADDDGRDSDAAGSSAPPRPASARAVAPRTD